MPYSDRKHYLRIPGVFGSTLLKGALVGTIEISPPALGRTPRKPAPPFVHRPHPYLVEFRMGDADFQILNQLYLAKRIFPATIFAMADSGKMVTVAQLDGAVVETYQLGNNGASAFSDWYIALGCDKLRTW